MSLRGCLGEGGAAGVTLLGGCRSILCSCVGPWMTDDKQPAHNCERMNERTNERARRMRRTVTEIVPRSAWKVPCSSETPNDDAWAGVTANLAWMGYTVCGEQRQGCKRQTQSRCKARTRRD